MTPEKLSSDWVWVWGMGNVVLDIPATGYMIVQERSELFSQMDFKRPSSKTTDPKQMS